MNDHTRDSELIDAYGGTRKVAALCDLTTGAVSQWRINGIPKAWRKFLRLAKPKIFRAWAAKGTHADKARAHQQEAIGGAVTRQNLRPDDFARIWPELADDPPQEAV